MKSTQLLHWLVLGNSFVVIGISAALAGAMIGVIVMDWSLLGTLPGFIFLELSLVVGSLQYAAQFRRNAWAAGVVAKFHLFGCAVSGFLFLTVLFSVSVAGVMDSRLLPPLLVISIYCGFCWSSRERKLIYEFTIDEAGFLHWANNMRRDCDVIQKGKPFKIVRYKMLKYGHTEASPGNDDIATITRGYFCESVPREKQKFVFAYDSATRRAYYFGEW
ncbi:MAG: hypothetical protein JXM70_19705 [Pirellulales bacterium]|nr:hypothetical protein [Pirellulales bacterium]